MKVSKLCTFAPIHVFHTKIKSLLPRFCYLLLLLLRAPHHHHHHRNETLPAVLRLSHQLNVNDVALLIATTKTPLPFLLLLPHRRPHRVANRNYSVTPSVSAPFKPDGPPLPHTNAQPKGTNQFQKQLAKTQSHCKPKHSREKSVTEKGGSVF